MSVKDKIILITGASDGIGKTVALEFAKKGAKLINLSRGAIVNNEEVLEALKNKNIFWFMKIY